MTRREWVQSNQLVVLGLCLMLGVVVASVVGSWALVRFKAMDTRTIVVTGAASKLISSDVAIWEPAVLRNAPTRAAVFAGLQDDVARVQGYLKQEGFEAKTVRILPPSINPVYRRLDNGNMSNDIEGFEGRQSVRVETPDVKGVERVANSIMSLASDGVAIDVMTPSYQYTGLDKLKVGMLAAATENARKRAQAMAKSSGNGIGPMRASQMGVFQITPATSTEVSDYGINDTSTIEKKVTAVVNITFALD